MEPLFGIVARKEIEMSFTVSRSEASLPRYTRFEFRDVTPGRAIYRSVS